MNVQTAQTSHNIFIANSIKFSQFNIILIDLSLIYHEFKTIPMCGKNKTTIGSYANYRFSIEICVNTYEYMEWFTDAT